MARDAQKVIADFGGLDNNSDPDDLPDGTSTVQVNLTSRIRGLLSTRRGYRFAAFETITVVESLEGDG